MSHKIKVLALDLEGTLISTIGFQTPRPGLYTFLEKCRALCERIVILSLVAEEDFNALAAKLVRDNSVPAWFATLEFIRFDGIIKDLRLIPGLADVDEALIIDDTESLIHPAQKSRWIRIEEFEYPFPSNDKEFVRIMDLLHKLVTTQRLVNPLCSPDEA